MLKRYRFGGPREAVVAADALDLSGQISELLALADGLAAQGRSAEAKDIYLALSQVAPGDARILKPLGILFATEQAWAQAAERLAAVTALPGGGDALVHNVLSVCRFELGDPAAALASAEQAQLRNPRFAAAHNNRGNALNRLGRPAEALEAFDAAVRLEPRNPTFLVNRANALRDLARPAEALEALELALSIASAIPAAHSNRGNLLQDLGRLEEAIDAFDRALALDPAYLGAHFGRGLCKLTLGRWDEGWADYEGRFTDVGGVVPRRAVPAPLWLGQESVAGKSVLLHAEQGLGDTIQFARYASAVAGLGARVRLQVQPSLVELLSQIDGVSQVLPLDGPSPEVDAHCPLMSLPLALARAGAPFEAQAPYLAAAPARIEAWRRRLRGKAGLNIGLVCSGSPTHTNDANRSLPLDLLEQALPVGPAYHLLQKEIRPRDLAALERRGDIHAPGEAFGDFMDTAAACAAMDLVVSVDTSVAHVSGALGRPTWLLLPARGDWRWGLEGERTHWYRSFRLYRAGPEGWAGILAALRRDLEALRG